MILGLLQCEQLDPDLLTLYGSYATMFIELFNKVNHDIKFKIYDVKAGEMPESIEDCDAYIITGSRNSTNDDIPWIKDLLSFVRHIHKSTVKLIGVCFGHQVVGKALGGRVIKPKDGWCIGVSENEILHEKSWMSPFQKHFNLYISHSEQIIDLPEGATILAKNDGCPYYMLQIGENILTIQGHPELNKEFTSALIHTRKNIIDPEPFNVGIQTLEIPVDRELIAEWMVNFINS